jgi:hypothetical protein
MRHGLSHLLAERRHSRRHHRERPVSPSRRQPDVGTQRPPDTAAQRVRDAGGPVDRASYSCQCGYVFAAAVSTTVACPHCGTGQAW